MRYFGIELQNNDTTSMEDVVTLLMFVFGHDYSTAFERMIATHRTGRALVAIFPEARLAEIKDRLDTHLSRLNDPVAYYVEEDADHVDALEVQFDTLTDWNDFEGHAVEVQLQTRNWTLGLVALIVIAVLILLL